VSRSRWMTVPLMVMTIAAFPLWDENAQVP
jgi:hypothetical protein